MNIKFLQKFAKNLLDFFSILMAYPISYLSIRIGDLNAAKGREEPAYLDILDVVLKENGEDQIDWQKW